MGVKKQDKCQFIMDLNLVKNLTQKISLFTIQLDHFFQIIYSKNLLNFVDTIALYIKYFDSIRRLQSKNIENVDRDKLKLVQTPQGFDYGPKIMNLILNIKILILQMILMALL